MRLALVAACLAGCGFSIEFGSTPTDGGDDDGSGSGSSSDGPNPFGCYGVGLVVVCPVTPPVPDYHISVATTIDTNVLSNCMTVNGTNVIGTCVIVAESITIEQDVRGIGPRPIVLVATKELVVSGLIDVASHSNSRGAGVSTTVCTNGNNPDGAGGGAGGSFLGLGGVGGNDGNGGAAGPTTTAPTSVRGGCRGQGGSGGFGVGGNGGYGGGAVYLIAGMSMTVSGRINASGEGGDGGDAGGVVTGGGGGGGAGGMIVLDAPTLQITGELYANGGGGGGGSTGVQGGDNGNEANGAEQLPSGGNGATGAGDGGDGTVGLLLDGEAGHARPSIGNGGGGGGGGAGYFKIYGSAQISGRVSPPSVP